jgi:hypothetical protein
MTDNELIQAVRERLPDGSPSPASEAELAEAEDQFGFRLHPLLRRIYLEGANGGWGPEFGASGLITGARPDRREHGTVGWLRSMCEPEDDPEAPDPWPGWPDGLVPVSTWGCAIWSCVDCMSPEGRVIRFDPNTVGAFDDDPWKAVWLPERPSLREWLIDWLEDRLPFEMTSPDLH